MKSDHKKVSECCQAEARMVDWDSLTGLSILPYYICVACYRPCALIDDKEEKMNLMLPTTPVKKWTFETAIKQLEFCDYEAIGGKLIWNDAFIWLKNILPIDHLAALESAVKEGSQALARQQYDDLQLLAERDDKIWRLEEQITTLTKRLHKNNSFHFVDPYPERRSND